MIAINTTSDREERRTNEQLTESAINILENAGLVGLNKVADQPVIKTECTQLYCQICRPEL